MKSLRLWSSDFRTPLNDPQPLYDTAFDAVLIEQSLATQYGILPAAQAELPYPEWAKLVGGLMDNTKIRKEVRGGGKKPWRQKGTGHARQGSIRAPQWTHGGVALGPKPRDYSYTINKKVKRLALLSALSDKAANGNLIVVDKIAADEFKTKTVVAFLAAVGAGKKNLILNDTADVKFVASAANIPGVKTAVDGVNTYDVVNADKLIVSLDAAKKLEEVYA